MTAVAECSAESVTGTAVDIGPFGSPAYQPLSLDASTTGTILFSPKMIRTHVLIDLEPSVATAEFITKTVVADYLPKCVRLDKVKCSALQVSPAKILASDELRTSIYFELTGPSGEPKRVLAGIRSQLSQPDSRLSTWLRDSRKLSGDEYGSIIRLPGGLVAKRNVSASTTVHITGWTRIASFPKTELLAHCAAIPCLTVVNVLPEAELCNRLYLQDDFTLYQFGKEHFLFSLGVEDIDSLASFWLVSISGTSFGSQKTLTDKAENIRSLMLTQKSLSWRPPTLIYAVSGILESCTLPGHSFNDFMNLALSMEDGLKLGACFGEKKCVKLGELNEVFANLEIGGYSSQWLDY